MVRNPIPLSETPPFVFGGMLFPLPHLLHVCSQLFIPFCYYIISYIWAIFVHTIERSDLGHHQGFLSRFVGGLRYFVRPQWKYSTLAYFMTAPYIFKRWKPTILEGYINFINIIFYSSNLHVCMFFWHLPYNQLDDFKIKASISDSSPTGGEIFWHPKNEVLYLKIDI